MLLRETRFKLSVGAKPTPRDSNAVMFPATLNSALPTHPEEDSSEIQLFYGEESNQAELIWHF